jgi:DNA-binding beta-propeller fold protein YncE
MLPRGKPSSESLSDKAAGIVMPPDGARAFLACSPDIYVVVIDQHSMKVVGRIEVGQDPDGLAWAPRSGTCESHR